VQTVWRRNLFFDYIKEYIEGDGANLRAEYKDFATFRSRYEISDTMLKEFRAYLVKKEVKIDEKEYVTDLPFIKARLRAQIAQMFFGTEGAIAVLVEVDVQVQKALTLFPEATKLAKLN
jgi:hypothetical protein